MGKYEAPEFPSGASRRFGFISNKQAEIDRYDLAGVLVDQDGVGPVAHPDIAIWRCKQAVDSEIGDPERTGEERSGQALADRPAAIPEARRSAIETGMEVARRNHGAPKSRDVRMRTPKRSRVVRCRYAMGRRHDMAMRRGGMVD